jgi:hypothetical protein
MAGETTYRMKGSAGLTSAVTILFTAGVAVALLARLDRLASDQRWQALAMALAFIAATGILSARAWRNARTSVVLRDGGIADQETAIAWSEVRRVEWHRVGPYESYILHAEDGRRIVLSSENQAFEPGRRLLHRHLPNVPGPRV